MVEYTILNAVTLIVGTAFLWNGYRIVRQGREAVLLFGMSALVGCALIIVALFPPVFTSLIGGLGVDAGRGILVFSNLGLFVLVTYLFHRIGQLYDSISRLNEEVSLLKTEVDQEND
jgi:hypothetical protein